MLRVCKSLSMAGSASKPNEDLIFRSDNCLAVLDGATNLIGSDYGAVRFTHDFAAAFATTIARSPLHIAVNAAIDAVRTAKFGAAPLPDDIALYASAAAVFVCDAGDKIQILTLGDCAAYLRTPVGMRKVFSPELDEIDDGVLHRLAALHRETGSSVRGLLRSEEIRAMLVANRRRMNSANGYAALSFDLPPLSPRDIVEFPRREVEGGLLYSDGFQLVETEMLAGLPFDALYARLRALEDADPDFNRYPRFKHGDDATVLEFAVA